MRAALGRLSDVYARVTGMTMLPKEGCIASTLELVKSQGGVAIGEMHGDYAFARFTKDLVKQAAQAGVRRLYIEMFQQRFQPVIDRWQDEDDAQEFIELINDHPTHSYRMWSQYWSVLRAAQNHGVRVVAIEPTRIFCPYPGTEMYMRNDAWMKCIEADQAKAPAPYIVYCGRAHLTRAGCNNGTPIQNMLGIAGVFMRRGHFGMSRVSGEPALYNLWVPKAPDQTPIYGNGRAINAGISYNP